LLKSMKLVCSGWQGPGLTTELPWRPGTWGNRTRTGPKCNLSDWPMQHNRSSRFDPEFYRPLCGAMAVVL